MSLHSFALSFSPVTTKHPAPAHLLCCLSRSPSCPFSAPICSFPHVLLSSHAVLAFLLTSRREPTSYQLLTGHLSVDCQQLKPSCSCTSPSMHGWAVTPISTLIPQTFSWDNFQPNNSAHLIQITESHAKSKLIRGNQKPPGEQKKRETAPLVSTAASG